MSSPSNMTHKETSLFFFALFVLYSFSTYIQKQHHHHRRSARKWIFLVPYPPKTRVSVLNSLHESLTIHCTSKDDDFGNSCDHGLQSNPYEWKYFWETTRSSLVFSSLSLQIFKSAVGDIQFYGLLMKLVFSEYARHI